MLLFSIEHPVLEKVFELACLLLSLAVSPPMWIVFFRQSEAHLLAKRMGGRAGFLKASGVRDGLTWKVWFRVKVTWSTLFGRRHRVTPTVRVHVEGPIGWTATRRDAFDSAADRLGYGGPKIGDPGFDAVICLDGDATLLAAVMSTATEDLALDWVGAGGEIHPSGVSLVVPDEGTDRQVEWIERAIATVLALRPPSDLNTALMARAISAELGPSLRAGAALGSSAPPALADLLRKRARAQLGKGHMEVPALMALTALETRSDDMTDAILPILSAPQDEVRLAAVRALGRLGMPAAVPALHELPAGAPWSTLSKAVDEATAEINRSSDAPWTHAVR